MVGRPLIRSRAKVNNIEVKDIMVGDEGKRLFSLSQALVHRSPSFSSKSSTNAGDQLSRGERHREQLGRYEAYLSLSIRTDEDEFRHEECQNLTDRSTAQSREESREDVRSDARWISIPRMFPRLSSDLDLVRAGHSHRCRGRHRRWCDTHLSSDRWILSSEFHCPPEHRRQRYHSIFDSSLASARSTCRPLHEP